MKELFKLQEVNFNTELSFYTILEIVRAYIEEKGELYEISEHNILYDPKSYVTNEPVWYVDVISIKVKERWPEAYDTLAISDREKRVVYVQNDHGIVVEKY